MIHQGDCLLTPSGARDDWGTCSDCDPDGRMPIPLAMHRRCPKRPVEHLSQRDKIEADITTDITPETRTMEDIRKTLDKCFGGCRFIGCRGHCTRWGTCGYEQKQAWYEYILANDCNDNNHVLNKGPIS